MSNTLKDVLKIDIGYSSCKIEYKGKTAVFPTAISFASDLGITYGDESVYKFEGETYYVGKDAVGTESFSTTNYKFLLKFAPLLIYHVLKKFDDHKIEKPVIIKTGLSINDWSKKDEFEKRLKNIIVNDETIDTVPSLIPQGAGAIFNYVKESLDGKFPLKIIALDFGFNTINLVTFENGKPVRKLTSGYPGHGVSSIVRPFTKYLEGEFGLSFSEIEANKIFVQGSFMYDGEEQQQVADKITELKSQFVKKIFNSVLVNDKKNLSTANKVILCGGGSVLLQGVSFPKNIEFAKNPIFANVLGF